jgi:gas vesicle structural protein
VTPAADGATHAAGHGDRGIAVERPDDDATLVDLLDRVIGRGVVVTGDLVLSVAGVDLVYVGLRLVLKGIEEDEVR